MLHADMLSTSHKLLLHVLLKIQSTAHLAVVMVRQGLLKVELLQQ